MSEYPKRPKFFAQKFTRLMAKCCAAQDIDPYRLRADIAAGTGQPRKAARDD